MAKLIFFCGKMASGKTTLARQLAARERAVVLNQDQLLEQLFPGEIVDVASYVKHSSRLNSAIGPLVCALLTMGTAVVLDFPGNTKQQRAWFRELFEQAGVAHELHFIDAPDALCKRQLQERSKHLPPGTPWTSEAEFDLIMAHFLPPSEDEGFNVIRHHHGDSREGS
ncbi:MAG: ATP-binding protein [Acidobacteriota bacterium]|nr:ATP-binding protein [Acidobacteriota bacterium]